MLHARQYTTFAMEKSLLVKYDGSSGHARGLASEIACMDFFDEISALTPVLPLSAGPGGMGICRIVEVFGEMPRVARDCTAASPGDSFRNHQPVSLPSKAVPRLSGVTRVFFRSETGHRAVSAVMLGPKRSLTQHPTRPACERLFHGRWYIIRRLLIMIPTLVAISVISFTIIQLPPGDFLTSYVTNLQVAGETVDQAEIDYLRHRFGLDQPLYIQYFYWAGSFLQGDMGYSFEWRQPVSQLIGERIPFTILISVCTILFTWAVALPIGIYSRDSSVFLDGLLPHGRGLPRVSYAQFSFCPDPALDFHRVLRHERGRPVLTPIR